jgi:hypothetical protein
LEPPKTLRDAISKLLDDDNFSTSIGPVFGTPYQMILAGVSDVVVALGRSVLSIQSIIQQYRKSTPYSPTPEDRGFTALSQ